VQIGAPMSSSLIRWTAGIAIVAGAVGVGLELANVHSVAGSVLVLLFFAVAPTAAFAGLLRTFDDGFARLIIAFTTNVVILALTAIVMLALGVWSPTGGLVAVVVITAVCLTAQVPPVRNGVVAEAAWWRSALQRQRPGPERLP